MARQKPGAAPAPTAPLWPSIFVAFIALGAFYPALKNGFVWDDQAMLVINPIFRRLDLRNLQWLLTTFHMGPYQPLSWASYTLDFQLWGMNPFGYHLTNLLLHAANAALVFILARALFTRISPKTPTSDLAWGAAAAALLFALHPLRVESVAWVTERRDVLSGFFYLLAALLYLRRRPVLSFCFFLLSLSAKAIGVTFPIALLILDAYILDRDPRESWEEKLPFFAAALAAGIAGYVGQARSHAMMHAQAYGAAARIAQTAYGLVFYVSKTFWPSRLLPLYEMPAHFDPWSALYIGCGAAVLALTIGLYYLRPRFPAAWAAWLFYAVTLFPVLGIVHFGPQIVADRNSYLACLSWPLLSVGVILSRPAWPRKAGLCAATAAAMVLAALTWQQAKVWHSDESLWFYTVAAAPNQSIPHNELGQALALLGKMPAAMTQFQQAVVLDPANASAHYNLGMALSSEKDLDKAMAEYRLALGLRPGYPAAGVNLGILLASQDKVEEAEALYRLVIAGNPDYAPAHLNLGIALANQKRWDEAITEFEQALRIYPRYREARYDLEQARLAQQGGLKR